MDAPRSVRCADGDYAAEARKSAAPSWFHSAGLVIGDISQADVLWSLTPGVAVHFLDCDGFRRVGRAAVQAQAGTPDWNDPLVPSTEASVDTDAYKTSLVAGRVLTQDPYVAPGNELKLVVGCLNDRQEASVRRLFSQAAGERGTAASGRMADRAERPRCDHSDRGHAQASARRRPLGPGPSTGADPDKPARTGR